MKLQDPRFIGELMFIFAYILSPIIGGGGGATILQDYNKINPITGLEIRILMMPVKARINTKFYCFIAKFNSIHAGQAHFSAGQRLMTSTYFMACYNSI